MHGIFVVVCPACGDEILAVDEEHGRCARCEQTYLMRVGYLIPIDLRVPIDERTSREITSSAAK